MSGPVLCSSVLWPATDTAVAVQAATVTALFMSGAWFARRNRDLLAFVGGLAALTGAAMALRTLH